jgi:hypothetical protein
VKNVIVFADLSSLVRRDAKNKIPPFIGAALFALMALSFNSCNGPAAPKPECKCIASIQIRGTVTDKVSSIPLEGVSVYLKNILVSSGREEIVIMDSIRTDKEGRYFLSCSYQGRCSQNPNGQKDTWLSLEFASYFDSENRQYAGLSLIGGVVLCSDSIQTKDVALDRWGW